jgi:large subunit ribosomal protein L24
MHIRKEDMVVVITGDDADPTRQRRVLRILPDENKVVVEGVNRVYKHLKPSRQNAQGGRLSKEMAVAASNVLIYCPTCKRGVRLGRRYAADGHKVRFCKNCTNELPGKALSKPRKAYAQK